jgi:isopenicillin N synthase-like dioxygenase
MRLLKYEQGNIQKESKPHTDYEFMTLVGSTVQDLEVKSSSGEWHNAPCHPGKALLLPGDMLQVVTDGWLQSPLHRVRFGFEARFAAIFFQGLDLDEKIVYPSFDGDLSTTFGGHLCGMLVRSSPHLMADVDFWERELLISIPKKNPFRDKKA